MTIESLRRSDPLQPTPPGVYECIRMRTGLLIIRTIRPTFTEYGQVVQVWPPTK